MSDDPGTIDRAAHDIRSPSDETTVMSRLNAAEPDVTLILDLDGVIRDASLSNAISAEVTRDWVGRPWAETVGEVGGDAVRRMVEDARAVGVSAFRQVTQRFPSGLELPIEYTTVRLGGKAGLIAIGKNLQAVAELQSRLIAAQHAREQDYWKLREIETRSRLLFDASNEAVLLVKAENLRITEANPAAIRALGLAPGWEFLREIQAKEHEPFQAMLFRVRQQGRAPGMMVHLGPNLEPWVVRASLMTAGPGSVFLLQLAPAGGSHAGEPGPAVLAVDELMDRLPEGFVVVDHQGVIGRANRAFLDLVQLGGEASAIGERLGRWLSRPGANLSVLLANVQRHGTVRMFLTTLHGEFGIDTEVEIAAVGNGAGKPPYFGVLIRDVSRASSGLQDEGHLRTALNAITEQIGKAPLLDMVRKTAAAVERHCIEIALQRSEGNRTAAAELLGLSRQSLYAKLNRYGFDSASHGFDAQPSSRQATASDPAGRPIVPPGHSVMPAFGQADLSNCEREQIHLAGSIQPHGALLLLREADLTVVQESANAAAFVSLPGPLAGRQLESFGGDVAGRVRSVLDASLHAVHATIRCHLGAPEAEFDALVHRPHHGGLVLELERAGPPIDLSAPIEAALQRILGAYSLRALGDETAQIFRELTGYDRVMVYRFDDEGHGEVFSERRRDDLEAYLGNRYPASDIPQIARRLYERSRVRVLVDADYTPVPLVPALSPLSGGELDMSLCFLRSMSPIHVQYMKNMGVSATLVASLVVGGRLWGLVACHHYVPRLPHIEVRTACELLVEAVATRIAALESFSQAQAELAVRRLEQRLIEAISREGEWRNALFDSAQTLLQPVGATGAALLFEGHVLTTGEVPGTQQLRDLGAWLDAQPRAPVIATASLGLDEPGFAPLTATASGVLAASVSNSPGEYLVWFRPERVRTVTWGGNPFKPVLVGDDPTMLSPRRSFAQWHQVVEGTSEPWVHADLAAARLIGDTVADVVLQFRSVRMLIAQNQLDDVRHQVRLADQPVIIADAEGHILLGNDAFHTMLPNTRRALRNLEDLVGFFADRAEFLRRLEDVIGHRHTWRGEVRLETDQVEPRPLLVRADPVFSAPGRVLGFVFLFTDLSDRKAAEAARKRFQESVVERNRSRMRNDDPSAMLLYRSLMSSVVENAQLAALEITDGLDMGRMADLLESVRGSVTRAAEVLEHLILQSRRATGHDGRTET